MTIIFYILFFIFVPVTLVRWSRWLAIVQQKEYRPDRLWLFLKSSEGKRDLFRIIPKIGYFSRRGMKRPVITKRVLFVGLVSFLIFICCFWLPVPENNYLLLLSFIVFYMFLPAIVFLSLLPSWVVSEIFIFAALLRASKITKKYNPIVVGITGSYGKTTTKILISHVLRQKFEVFMTPKSFNTRYSVAKSILSNYRGQKFLVLEYAAYRKGEIKALARFIKPSVAIITGLTEQHLGIFGSVEKIIEAKSELIKSLNDKSQVFYNGTDDGAKKICNAGGAENPISYSGQDSSVKTKYVSINENGRLKFKWENRTITTRIIGTHYLEAVKASILIGQRFGLENEEIGEALESFDPDANFILTRQLTNGAFVIDDGRTANPAGFRAAVNLLKLFKEKKELVKTLLVFAGIVDLGKDSSKIHLGLAEAARDIVDEIIYLGIDGLSEFRAVFQQNFIYGDDEVKKKFKTVGGDTIILIEGYTPKWIYETYLQ
jgi:UDP-N-acetylmuramoyl-tripeptide--D-alanyl-D-alanine ligase